MNESFYSHLSNEIGVSRKVMRELDRKAIEDYEIPGLLLMENAGRNVAEEAMQELENRDNDKVAVICGKGNNGGDGFVIARHLYNFGYDVHVFLISKVKDVIGDNDAGINLKILLKMDITVNEVVNDESSDMMLNLIPSCALVVDAIFGTGLKGELREPALSIVKKINELKVDVISVDIPSGLDCDKGTVLGACVKALKTVTFALPKKGFFLGQGPFHVGELIVTDISIPKGVIDESRVRQH